MPALQQSVLQPALETAFKAVLDDKGNPFFAKRNLDGTVTTPVELADGTKKMIEAISAGIVSAWKDWQPKQTVLISGTVADTVTHAPVAGLSGPESLP